MQRIPKSSSETTTLAPPVPANRRRVRARPRRQSIISDLDKSGDQSMIGGDLEEPD